MNLIFSPARHVTVVQWQFQQRLSWYPWEKLGSIMNDKIIGPMMEKNLGNLKKIVEKTN
jgi:thiamine kinase-like enzyme